MIRTADFFYRSWLKQLLLSASFLALFFLGYLSLFFLNREQLPFAHFSFALALILSSFFLPIALAWHGSRTVGFFVVFPIASVFIILTAWVLQSFSYLFFLPSQWIFLILLFYLDQKKEAEIIIRNVEAEKAVNQKNDLEIAFKEEGTSISVFFEKYTSYYNLRNLATDFSTTLSLKELSQIIVSKTMGLIPRGRSYFLFLTDPATAALSLVASKGSDREMKTKTKSGSMFDFWVFRNRQSLIISDLQKDFRFDMDKAVEGAELRSVIVSPLIHEGKVVGTLRVNSEKPGAFSTDELRLLDAIATLASSAISNAILFQKTEELAIRDSLTGLYVQRYFLERLSDEHRRSLLTHAPLSFLMCDLDHFKECNDRYGHGVGDHLLVKVSELIAQKATDGIVARYGGEEFSILLPKCSFQEAQSLAESIRQAVAVMSFTVRRQPIPATISIGVASIPQDTLDSEELIRIADKRLYQAKKDGRNKVCGAG
ncbi:MAG: hypothetical protein A3C35_00965 [Omnitrophica bacterium RIFCSPHIGHO2_02_FULL_46_11]|nr:MAG: hypothetical protein A3C35_00965 [Omnitrophica bacterium RIFCSPHIGHO2_02_FULL_46_11]